MYYDEPIIAIWAISEYFWYSKIFANLNNYFDRHVCPSSFRTSFRTYVTKFFFRLNHLGIIPRPPGHAAPPEELARAQRALSNTYIFWLSTLEFPQLRVISMPKLYQKMGHWSLTKFEGLFPSWVPCDSRLSRSQNRGRKVSQYSICIALSVFALPTATPYLLEPTLELRIGSLGKLAYWEQFVLSISILK